MLQDRVKTLYNQTTPIIKSIAEKGLNDEILKRISQVKKEFQKLLDEIPDALNNYSSTSLDDVMKFMASLGKIQNAIETFIKILTEIESLPSLQKSKVLLTQWCESEKIICTV